MKHWRKPLDRAGERKKAGKIVVTEDRCKGCGFCVAFCPREVLRMSAGYNRKGYHCPEVADDSRCAACHFCEVLCPEFAIYVLEHPSEAQ